MNIIRGAGEIRIMLNGDVIMKRIEGHEGCRLMPYYDTKGKLTIGIGRCIDTNPFTPEELLAVGDYQHGITKNAALMLLRNDIEKCLRLLESKIFFFKELDSERQYALIDLCFQLGIKGLLKFRKMLRYMRFRRWDEAAKECLNSKYASVDTPKRARRIAELIKTGRWKE